MVQGFYYCSGSRVWFWIKGFMVVDKNCPHFSIAFGTNGTFLLDSLAFHTPHLHSGGGVMGHSIVQYSFLGEWNEHRQQTQ
jgi:hypothetical protein